MLKYFKNAFAVNGSKSTVPDDVSGDDVSYDAGFGADYELDPTDVSAKFVERDDQNGLFYDMTVNLKQWQEEAYPQFIESSQNDSTAFGYPINAVVKYNSQAYVSLIDDNTDTPPTSNWARLDPNPAPVGSIVMFGGSSAPVGWVLCDGSSVARVGDDYDDLFDVIGETYGTEGTAVFNLPDLRGVFPRGLDDGRGLDSDRVLGTYQEDAFKTHTHTETTGYLVSRYDRDGGGPGAESNTSATTGSTGGTETRPKNLAINFIIKL